MAAGGSPQASGHVVVLVWISRLSRPQMEPSPQEITRFLLSILCGCLVEVQPKLVDSSDLTNKIKRDTIK